MTDILTIAPIEVRRSDHCADADLPRLGMGAQFAAIFAVFGDALKLTYAEPYIGRRRHVAPKEGQDGRDPDW